MPAELIYAHPWATRAWILIEAEALQVVSKYQQQFPGDHEAGGILMGYRRGSHLHVIGATAPMAKDQRSRFSFDRFDSRHQEIALKYWEESHKRCDYLGEWHTHPQKTPTLSWTDEREWRKLLSQTPRSLIFWIEGIEGRWMGLGRKRKISQMWPAE